MTKDEREILDLTQRLLDAIANADWRTYENLCDPTLTALEPEAKGQVVEGLAFHKFYFQFGPARDGHRTNICSPSIRVVGDLASIAYVRLNQRVTDTGPVESAHLETRLWQRKDGSWKHVHFHRSPA